MDLNPKGLSALKLMRYSACLGAVVVGLMGCATESPKTVPAPIEGYNHTSAAINGFTVNGAGGPNVGPHQGGGKQTCCVQLPEKWHPGLKVVVEWEKDPNAGASRNWSEPMFSDAWRKRMEKHRTGYTRHRATVEVAPYEIAGPVDVHFFPCDQIKISAVTTVYGHTGYPYNQPLKMEEPTTCSQP